MRRRCCAIVGFWTIEIAVLAFASNAILGQASPPAKAASRSTVQRTPDGRPDLQGIWNTGTITPLERPAQFAGTLTITEAEAAAYATQFLEADSLDRRDRGRGKSRTGGYNDSGLIGEHNSPESTALFARHSSSIRLMGTFLR